MTAPKRIQRKRTKGWRMPEGAVYVGRPTIYSNPYQIVAKTTCNVWLGLNSQWRNAPHWHAVWPDGGSWCYPTKIEAAERAVDLFDLHVGPMGNHEYDDDTLALLRHNLAGHDLACWCPLEDADGNRVPCHADVLLEIANGGAA